jgi:hypothetical protein
MCNSLVREQAAVNWIYVQIRQKRLLIDRQPTGADLFQDTTVVLDAVRSLWLRTDLHIPAAP